MPDGTKRQLCRNAFCGDLLFLPEVEVPRSRASLRNAHINFGHSGIYGAFGLGGINTDTCHIVPSGVPGLLRTVCAPRDYTQTVKPLGQRLHGKQWKMQNGKGVNLEFQMNVIHY